MSLKIWTGSAFLATAAAVAIYLGGGGEPPAGTAVAWVVAGGGTCTGVDTTNVSWDDSASPDRRCGSFDQAYDEAPCDGLVYVRSDITASQDITGNRSCSSNDRLQFEEAPTESVVLSGLNVGNNTASVGPDNLSFEGFSFDLYNTEPVPENQTGLDVKFGATYVDMINMDAGSLYIQGAQNVRILGGDYGPCNAWHTETPGVFGNCGNSKIEQTESPDPKTKDILVEGARFHTYRFDDSCFLGGADCHYECMYLTGATENYTIRGNRFEGCAIFDIFVTFSTVSGVRAAGHKNLIIENNWLNAPFNEPSYQSTARSTNAIMLAHCDDTASDVTTHYDGLRIRGNTFVSSNIVQDGTTCRTTNGAYATGNIMRKAGCISWLSQRYNILTGGGGTCDASESNISSTDILVDSNDASGIYDFHLAGSAGSTAADNFVPTSVLGGCAPTDYDEVSRPVGSNCDAGSDER